MHASYLWFKGQNDIHAPSESGGNKDPPNEPAMEDQIYWQDSIEEYNDPLEFGPEIPSSIAGAAKVFWKKSLKSDIIDQKMANVKIPSDCHFLVPKCTNKEIFVTLSSFLRTVDNQVQELQKIQAASVTMLFEASS